MNIVDQSIDIAADAEKVWRHLTERNLLTAWLMRNDFKPEVGHEFSFRFKPSGAWDGTIRCKVLEVTPPRRLSFTWNANEIGADTVVTIDLEPSGEGTRVTLRHSNWEQAKGDWRKMVREHDEGWLDHLRMLAQQVKGRGAASAAAPDWTAFDLHLAIAAPAEAVFAAWATGSGLESFLVEMVQIEGKDGALRGHEDEVRAGDRYAWRWYNGHMVEGEFLSVSPGRELVFTFGPDAKVRIAVHGLGKRTLLHLHQFDMPDTPAKHLQVNANCRSGWTYFMTLLKVLLEHGIDGRDKSRDTAGSLAVGYDPVRAGVLPGA